MCNWDIGVSSFYRLQGRFPDLLEEGFKAICLPAYSRLLTGVGKPIQPPRSPLVSDAKIQNAAEKRSKPGFNVEWNRGSAFYSPLPCNGGTSGGGVSTHYFPDNIYTCLRTIEFRRGVPPRSDRVRSPALLSPHNGSPNKDWASFNDGAGYAYAGPPNLSLIHLHYIIIPYRLHLLT